MKENDKDLLSELEDANFYGALDYAISHANYQLLDLLLKDQWSNQSFRKAISNNLLSNVLEKSPSSEFCKKVINNLVSDFTYEDLEGNAYHFILEEPNE